MRKPIYARTRSAWADPLDIAREILDRHPRFRRLTWCSYWGLAEIEFDKRSRPFVEPLVGGELEDAVRLHVHRTRRTWASDRLVDQVIAALGLLCRRRAMRRVA